MSLSDWQEEATPYVDKVHVCFDRALVAELEEAQARLAQESKGQLESPPELENHVAELSKKVEAKTRTFVFSSIGKGAWRKLLADHPPTEAQLKADPSLDNNPETFPQAAMVACCTEPGMTVEQANWIATELPEMVFLRFWNAVLRCNVLGGDEKKAVTAAAHLSVSR